MLIKAWWDMRSVGGVKWPVTFAGFLPLPKSHAWVSTQNESDMRLNRAPLVWATPSVCEEVPRCMWNLMRRNKEKEKKKRKKEGQNTFSMVKKQKEDMESHPSCFLSLSLCFILTVAPVKDSITTLRRWAIASLRYISTIVTVLCAIMFSLILALNRKAQEDKHPVEM